MLVEMSACATAPGAEVQRVSPITTLEGLAAAVGALNRTALGLEGFVLLLEIDRLNRKQVHPDLEMLRRIVGAPKSQVWTRLFDLEGMNLIRTRHVRRLQRLVIAITPAGREALACAARALQQGGDRIDQGGALKEQGSAKFAEGWQNLPGAPVNLTADGEAQNTTPTEPMEGQRQRSVRSRSRPQTRDLHVVGA